MMQAKSKLDHILAIAASALNRERPVSRRLQQLVFIVCLLSVAQNGLYAWISSGLRVSGSVGMSVGRAQCDADHFCPVTAVRDGSPAQRTGILAGDRVRYDRRWEMYRSVNAGEAVGFTMRRGNVERHADLSAEPRQFYSWVYLFVSVFGASLGLTGALIAARAGRTRTNLLLAVAMACASLPGNYPRAWQNAPGLFEFFFLLLSFLLTLSPILLAAAMRRYRREVTGTEPRWIVRAFWPVAVLTTLGVATGMFIAMNAAPLLGINDGLSLVSIVYAVASLAPPLILLTRWSNVPAGEHTRYAFMAAAVTALSTIAWIDPVIMLTTNNYTEASWPLVVQVGALTSAAFLFAYAILRHRAIDLGFAINRTLVYSTLSAVMLAFFALAEKGAEKLLPEDAHRAGVLVQAAIALAIFIAFHRLRDAVEHWVERVFFARWREYEARLSTFMRQASFITRPDTLIDRTLNEFSCYTDGADVAIYRAARRGYELAGGVSPGFGQWVDPDETSIVALRADRELLRGKDGCWALLLPMVHRAEVMGFVAVGKRRDGGPYRPDEETQLARAAHQVGLDLHALRVEELERENAALSVRVALASAAV